jgi:hypothetical protein
LQGFISSYNCVGLYYKEELIALQSFGKSRFENDKLELLRLVTKLGISVVGGHEKLFKYFNKNYNKDNLDIISYSDNCHFNGNIYSKLNFKFLNEIKPSYFYIKKFNDYIIYNEEELPILDEYDKVWNTGNKKFIYHNNFK